MFFDISAKRGVCLYARGFRMFLDLKGLIENLLRYKFFEDKVRLLALITANKRIIR